MNNFEVEWRKGGYYELLPQGGPAFDQIRHISGAACDLSGLGHTIDGTWHLDKTYDALKTTLCKGCCLSWAGHARAGC